MLCECFREIGTMDDHTSLKEEMHELARSIDHARLAAQREDWGTAVKGLTRAQDRISRLLREIGDKQREMQLTPVPDQADRG